MLPSGDVLVIGGIQGAHGGSAAAVVGAAELRSPVTGAWSIAGTMSTPRYCQTATLLPSGQVLVAGGTAPVAILSSATFDATTVNPTTVTLAGATVKLKGQGTPMASIQHVNNDSRADLVVHISTEALQLSETDTVAILNGQTYSGQAITGSDTVRIVP